MWVLDITSSHLKVEDERANKSLSQRTRNHSNDPQARSGNRGEGIKQ